MAPAPSPTIALALIASTAIIIASSPAVTSFSFPFPVVVPSRRTRCVVRIHDAASCNGSPFHANTIQPTVSFHHYDNNESQSSPDPSRSSSTNNQSRRNFGKHVVVTTSSSLAASAMLSSSQSATAITPQEASTSYDTYASNYDSLDGGKLASSLGIDEARRNVLAMARGNVLEIGVGTGLNLGSYQFCTTNSNNSNAENDGESPPPSCGVTSLTLVDISENMLRQAQSRIESLTGANDIPIKVIKADATSELSSLFGDGKFDTVVDTFSLCVMGNEGARKCLEQMRHVVKGSDEGGQILLIENTRASNPLLGYYQDLTASTAADVGGKGCLYNQNVSEMIRQTDGLRLVNEKEFAAGFFRSFVCEKVIHK